MRFNLSEWALRNRPIVLFAILMLGLLGAWSYKHLGQSEDPPFTFKAMVVRTMWPGATAEEVSRQVTEPHRKETDGDRPVRVHPRVLAAGRVADHLHRQGFAAQQGHPDALVPGAQEGRRHQGDPAARRAVGPFFNDEFGDTFGNIYALTGDGFDYAQLKDYAERWNWSCSGCPTSARST
jgi:multidrug efflux pump